MFFFGLLVMISPKIIMAMDYKRLDDPTVSFEDYVESMPMYYSIQDMLKFRAFVISGIGLMFLGAALIAI